MVSYIYCMLSVYIHTYILWNIAERICIIAVANNPHRRYKKRYSQQESNLVLSTTKKDFPVYEAVSEKIEPITINKDNPLYDKLLKEALSTKPSTCELINYML